MKLGFRNPQIGSVTMLSFTCIKIMPLITVMKMADLHSCRATLHKEKQLSFKNLTIKRPGNAHVTRLKTQKTSQAMRISLKLHFASCSKFGQRSKRMTKFRIGLLEEASDQLSSKIWRLHTRLSQMSCHRIDRRKLMEEVWLHRSNSLLKRARHTQDASGVDPTVWCEFQSSSEQLLKCWIPYQVTA